jgi:hypothetical protein
MNELEYEKRLAARDTLTLFIGILIAMVIVALTLDHPGETQGLYQHCYEVCKELIERQPLSKEGWFATSGVIEDIGSCMSECRFTRGK